ncbi:Polysaccharide deacetylase [Roseivivax sp. THAF40]|uniref:polysaccharide deacetylase family protein n=1 Tax=unclassified Roseivivax TaxID=2639302 RepID=UPI001268A45C|nr:MULTISPECIES: polysaccharide deacetylase family protein [unclassified Roseivivax]QFS83570.1 Polysaccharide deacetylase [Roseivivax sp. THAF197b]QFT47315.1 Polysaccharide deacetylase [Roseivivax sp. THAF40]
MTRVGIATKPDATPRSRGGFVLSLDFELNWGVVSNASNAAYWPNIIGARSAIPKLLDLFREYDLRCTWVTTGLLYFDRRDDMLAALPRTQPRYEDASLSSYAHLDGVGADEDTDPLHFGLSLIRKIKACPGQEIGTHTFSHYFCRDAVGDPKPFEADLEAARQAAARIGVHCTSIVFPRNQVTEEALEVCARHGLTAFRGNARGWIYRSNGSADNGPWKRLFRLLDSYLPIVGDQSVTPSVEHGMVNIPASCFLRPYSKRRAALEGLRLSRIKREMRRAAERDALYHLWFHPHNFGADQDENMAVMRDIAAEAVRLDREFGWPSKTMADIAQEVLPQNAEFAGSIRVGGGS